MIKSTIYRQLRTRDSPGQDKYGSANIAVSEDGSLDFPPTSRNTLAEGVLHCEAYISCRLAARQPWLFMAFFRGKLALKGACRFLAAEEQCARLPCTAARDGSASVITYLSAAASLLRNF